MSEAVQWIMVGVLVLVATKYLWRQISAIGCGIWWVLKEAWPMLLLLIALAALTCSLAFADKAVRQHRRLHSKMEEHIEAASFTVEHPGLYKGDIETSFNTCDIGTVTNDNLSATGNVIDFTPCTNLIIYGADEPAVSISWGGGLIDVTYGESGNVTEGAKAFFDYCKKYMQAEFDRANSKVIAEITCQHDITCSRVLTMDEVGVLSAGCGCFYSTTVKPWDGK